MIGLSNRRFIDAVVAPTKRTYSTDCSVDKNAAGSSSTTLSTAADLRVTIVPTDVDVDGSGELMTSLKMKRLFDIGYADKLQAPANDDPVTVPIEYSHIPYLNTAPAAYSIEFCGIERILDIVDLGLDERITYGTFHSPISRRRECALHQSLRPMCSRK